MFVAIAIIIPVYYYLLLSFHRPTLPTPTTMAGIDKFDIRKIYPTKPGGEQWYFNIDDPNNDPRTGEGGGPSTTFVQKNDDGSWKVQSTEVRYGVLTSSGYHPELITTLNQHDLAAKGYMQSPNDWKNLEMTGYFKVNSFTDSTQNGAAHIELVARGGRNTNELTKIKWLARTM